MKLVIIRSCNIVCFFTRLVKWGKLAKYAPEPHPPHLRRGDRCQVCPSSQDTWEKELRKGWLVLDCTWLKALKWINDHQPGPGIKKAQEMFKVNESDTDTLLLFKKKALELAILIVQECESGSSMDALMEELLVLIERANVIRKEM